MKSSISLIIVIVLLIAGGALVMMGDPSQRADLSSVMELAGDAQRAAIKPLMFGTSYTDEQEQEIGNKLAKSFSWHAKNENENFKKMHAYVAKIGNSLLSDINRKNIRYTFHLIDHDIVNAFAMPGGHIFVFSGLLNFLESEAELAGILGHEIVHVDARHCIEMFQAQAAAEKLSGPLVLNRRLRTMVGALAAQVMTGGYRKFQEFEADLGGMKLAAKAGYDPKAIESAMERLGNKFGGNQKFRKSQNPLSELGGALKVAVESYYSSHPPARERVAKLANQRNSITRKLRRFYLGKKNLAQLQSKSQLSIPEEFINY